MERIPLLLYGDGPRLPSGLGRIARDLLLHLSREQEELGIAIHQVGVDPPDGWHFQAWPFWGFQPDAKDQGRGALDLIVPELTQQFGRPPVVLMVMDPSRCFDLTRYNAQGTIQEHDLSFWGYFPVDAENVLGAIGDPAAQAIWACDRVLAYGRYGARVLQRTLQQVGEAQLRKPARPGFRKQHGVSVGAVPCLPHGLDPSFRPGVPLATAGPGFTDWRTELGEGTCIIGCVATNQARKDLSLLFASASVLKREGQAVGVWLHTDRLMNAWNVGQLCIDFGLQPHEVCVSSEDTLLSDEQLAARYWASDATLGVGLGEGFGYPLVESLACGTPVVHARYAGGVELIPRGDWLVDAAAWRLESCYAVKRPVLKPEDVASALALAMAWKRDQPQVCAAYCSGAVSYLRWDVLWPRWRAWMQRGLQEERTRGVRKKGKR